MTPTELALRQVRQHFSAHAGEYDRYAVVQKTVVRRLLELLPEQPERCGPALDIGCGTGELARQLRARLPQLPLAVADIAHGMTCCAARLPGVHAFDADARALPVADGRFGLVCSSSMYQWVEDLAGAFGENLRVLRPGGAFVFALFGTDTLCELRAAYQQALDQLGNPFPSHMQEFADLATVRRALQQAGLQIERLETGLEVEQHSDVATLLKNLKHIGAQNAARQRPSGLGLRRVTLRMMEIYTDRFGGAAGIPASYQVIYGRARRPE